MSFVSSLFRLGRFPNAFAEVFCSEGVGRRLLESADVNPNDAKYFLISWLLRTARSTGVWPAELRTSIRALASTRTLHAIKCSVDEALCNGVLPFASMVSSSST